MMVKQNFSNISYTIIDEENLNSNSPFSAFDETEYQFVLDPIDGTLTYAYKTPLFAISLGIMKKGKPYQGFVYAPALGELVYFDGHCVKWPKNAFQNNQEEVILKPQNSASPLIFKNARTLDLKQDADVKGNLELNLWSCVLHHLYLLTGRAKAAFVSAMFWDIAGTWGALEHLGFKIYNTQTGEILEKVSLRHFTKDYRFIAPHLICKSEDYSEIINLIKNKKASA